MKFTFHNGYIILEVEPNTLIFLDRTEILTQKLLTQGYNALRLKSSLQKFYGRHHNLVDRYEISISQMTMDLLLFTHMFSFLFRCQDMYRTSLYIGVTWRVSCNNQELLTVHEYLSSPRFFDGVRVAHSFSFL